MPDLNTLFGHTTPPKDSGTFIEQDALPIRSGFVLDSYIPQTPSVQERGQKSIRGIHKKPWTEERRENFKKSIRKSKKHMDQWRNVVLTNVYHIRSPDGKKLTTINLREFSRRHSLTYKNLYYRRFSKGYRIEKIVPRKPK